MSQMVVVNIKISAKLPSGGEITFDTDIPMDIEDISFKPGGVEHILVLANNEIRRRSHDNAH